MVYVRGFLLRMDGWNYRVVIILCDSCLAKRMRVVGCCLYCLEFKRWSSRRVEVC